MTSDPSPLSGSSNQKPPYQPESSGALTSDATSNPPPLDDLLEEPESMDPTPEEHPVSESSLDGAGEKSLTEIPEEKTNSEEGDPQKEPDSTYGTYDSEEDYQSGHTSDHPDYTDGMQDEDYHNEDPHARYANAYGHDTVYHEEPYIEDDPHYQASETQYPHEEDPYEDPTGAHLEVAGGSGNGGYGGRGGPPETDLLDPSEMDPDEELYNQGEIVKPFLEHLEDLRWTLVKVIVCLVVGMVVCLVAGDTLTQILTRPLLDSGVKVELMTEGPAVGIIIALKIAFFGGIILSGPFIFYFLAEFVVPALKPKEKKYLAIAFLIGAGLFLSGVSFCYFLVLGVSLKALAGYSQWLGLQADYWLATEYFGFVLKFMLGMGISFEMPVVILTLVKLEILTYQQLESNRRIMVVICLIVAAILTPPDALSMFLLGGPLYALFESCIWIARYWDYRDRKRAGLAG